MARTNPFAAPLSRIKHAAMDALHDPRATAEKAVEHAKDTVALGRTAAEGVVGQVAERVSARRGHRRGTDAPSAEPSPARERAVAPAQPGRAVPPTPSPADIAKKVAAKKAPARRATATKAAKKAPAKKATVKKATVKRVAGAPATNTARKAPATEAAAREAPATKASAKEAPAKKSATKKAPAKKGPAKEATATPASSPGDRLPPRRTAPTKRPTPTPRPVEPNPEATPRHGD